VGVRWLDPARGDPSRYTATALLLVTASTALTALIAAWLAPRLGVALAPWACALAAVVAGANVVQGMRFAIWQNRQRPLPAAALQVSSAVANIVLSLLGVLWLGWGGDGRIAGAAIAAVGIALLSVVSMFREGAATHATQDDARALLRFGVPLVPHVLAAALIASADRFAVSSQLGEGVLGVYGTAAQLGLIITVLADAFVKAYTPVVYGLLGKRSASARLKVVAITYLSIPFWLVLALAIWCGLRLLAPWLLGPEYREAVDLSLWFLLGGALSGIYLNLACLFFFTGKTERISLATVSAAAAALLLAVPAVKAFGVVGGVITFVGAQALLLVLVWALSVRVFPMPWHRPRLALRVLRRRALFT
jgi:O-antigen/teichoic acid export membrane protein